MSLTTNSSLKSARRKYFHELDVHHARKQESNVFGLRRPK